MANTDQPKKRLHIRSLLIAFAAVALLLLASACSSEPDEPSPTEAPVVTEAPGPGGVVNPVNGASPEDVNDTLRTLSEEDGVLLPTDSGYLYTDEEGDVFLSVSDPAEVEEALEAQPLSGEEGTPSVITGVAGNADYIAIASGGSVTVYITVGDQTVKAETVDNDGAKGAKRASSVASSVVTASKTKEAYERGRDDYDHNKAAYYMDAADCLIFYPAQLTKKTAFEDQSVIFSDPRSSVTCSVRLEYNPYTDIEELESLMADSPHNTVLGWGDDWLTSETVRDGMVTFSFTGLGKKYMVTAELCYPRKYSFVFDELRELISVRFLEGNKWVNGNRKPKPKPEYGAPSYGLQECFYPEFDLFLVLPDTLDEQAVTNSAVVFHDNARNRGVTVELFEIPESERGDLFKTFYVVARDGDLVLGDDFVRWHNSSGMFIGTVSGTTAALLSFDGGDAFTSYEAVYSELTCHLADRYFEPQPLSDGKKKEENLEPQPTEGPEPSMEPQPTEGPEPSMEPQPTAAPDAPLEPQPTAGPTPRKAPPRQEPNRIDKAVEKKVAEKAKEEYPSAPDQGSDPLEYYTDADFRAVNITLEDYVDCYPSEEETIAGVILKVLRYNGYAEADWYDAEGLMLAIGEVLEEIDDGLFEFRLFGTGFGLPADLFPYVCEALYMDAVPEYRSRPQSDPPAPQWLEDLRENEYYDEEDLDWDAVREWLDNAYPLPDFTRADIDPSLFTDGQTVPGGPEAPDQPEPEPEPGRFPAESLSWPEYGIYFSEEEVREAGEQVDWYFNYYLDLAKQDEWYQEEGLNSVGDYLLEDAPHFEWIGEDLPARVGFYQTAASWYDEEEPEEVFYMMISEEGIWAAYDPDSWEILDCGILIPGSDDYGDMWYSVTSDGEFMTLWEFDYGILNTSKYGSLSFVWPEDN